MALTIILPALVGIALQGIFIVLCGTAADCGQSVYHKIVGGGILVFYHLDNAYEGCNSN